jgi:threonine-phosphate decarboxylase
MDYKMITGHGGNIFDLARKLGCDPSAITDMSSNVNPAGALPGIKAYLAERLPVIESLPEADGGTITGLFAKHNGVEPDNVAPGNGSTQLLYAIPRALSTQKALIVGPTYTDYTSACRQQGVTPDTLLCTEEDGFKPDLGRIESLAGQYDTVFICNPNNPTGVMAPHSDLATLFASLPETVFIVDESYLPFAENPDRQIRSYSALPNVIRLTSMSKIFKIPGLRIGFALAKADVIAKIKKFAMPWSVNSLACEAVAYILNNGDRTDSFIRETREFLAIERAAIEAFFKGSPHIQWFPSCTSFMLARLKGLHAATAVCTALATRRILIRNCSNFEGLSEKFIRVSLKSHAENRRLHEILSEVLETS